ncbi:nucleoporin Nup85-like protein [Schizophyllum amplum]|uniref:Nuclear pore complex protein Nup85 n=1 Tax=Schizophyllum amplum TaxID=97359 RepID=A0A550CKW8_9AGAR|nr:nucleoporin Nup85-like protein [Auriculariopsis ampla]
MCSFDDIPDKERHAFITDTTVIFNFLQNLLKNSRTQSQSWQADDKVMEAIRKLCVDYVEHIKEIWVDTNKSNTTSGLGSDHYQRLLTGFSLFVLLFVPEPGFEDAPFGEDLMEWLNMYFIAPSTEDGEQLSTLDKPWEHENFWTYLKRTTLRGLTKATTFFLDTLSRHPSENLPGLAQQLIPIIDAQPHLQNFTSEREFMIAYHRWRERVKAIRVEMERVPDDDRADEVEFWWDNLSDIVGVLEGRKDVVHRVCEEFEDPDWKEVCAAWGIFVNPRLRRQELPDIVGQILESLPPDPTYEEDMVHATLLSDQPVKALQYAAQLDPWLGAHMADVMEALTLIDNEPDLDTGLSTRDTHILAYADYMHSDTTLWRQCVDYMYSCCEQGKTRADEVLLHVPLRLQKRTPTSANADEDIRHGDLAGALKEISQTCFENQREDVRRTVCRIAAQTLVREKEYGLAISYCKSAEDWAGLGRVIDRILNEYIAHGPEAFVLCASQVAPSLQEWALRGESRGVFMHRLMFAVCYARFHDFRGAGELQNAATELVAMLQDGVAPRAWWAVLLSDAVELLQHDQAPLFSQDGALQILRTVNEVSVRALQGGEDDYLDVLRRVQGGDFKDMAKRLKVVRLTLAKYFSRYSNAEGSFMH